MLLLYENYLQMIYIFYIYIFDIEKWRIQSLDNTKEVNLKVKECFKFMEQYTEEVVILKDNKLEYIYNILLRSEIRIWVKHKLENRKFSRYIFR